MEELLDREASQERQRLHSGGGEQPGAVARSTTPLQIPVGTLGSAFKAFEGLRSDRC